MSQIYINNRSTIVHTYNNESGGQGCGCLLIILAIIWVSSNLYTCTKKKLNIFDNYITLTQNTGYYKSIEENPKDKQILILAKNTQLKPIKLFTKNYTTWIYVWFLNKNIPEKGYVLITKRIDDIEDYNSHFGYGNSEIWNNYYKLIDKQNHYVYNQIALAFFSEVDKYPIFSTSDNIEKEKISKDDSIEKISTKGFFGKWQTNNKTAFFCKKIDLKNIEEIYKIHFEKYEKSKLKYLPE